MVSSRVLKDVGLALLGVVTVAAAGYVLLRDPLPSDVGSLPVPAVVSSPVAAATPTPLPTASTPSTPTVVALMLRSPGTPAGHITAAGRALGWRVTETDLSAGTLPPSLQQRQVVLVQAGRDDRERVVEVVQQVRASAPAVRLVVLAPLTGPVVGRQLGQAVQGARTEVLDPVGLGWLQGQEVFAPNGSLTPEGARTVGARLAAVLA